MRFRFCGDLDCPDWVLSEVATLSKLSSVRIKVLVNQILSFCLAGEFNYEKVSKLISDSADGVSDIKGSVAAVHYMITNAAKYDVDEQSLVQEIQQLGLPKENSENIGKAYRSQKDALREILAEKSYQISKLVALDWRVDHVVASSDMSNESLVQLKFSVNTRPGSLTAASEGTERLIDEFAVEVKASKLDIMISELSRANELLVGMQS